MYTQEQLPSHFGSSDC